MKYILSFLFLCVVFQCIQANEDRDVILKKMARAALALRNIVKAKEEKMRKLQQATDQEPEPGFTVSTIPADIPNSSTIQPAQNLSNVPQVEPVADQEPEPGFTVSTIPADIPANSSTIQEAQNLSNVPQVEPVATEDTNSTTTDSGYLAKKFYGFKQQSNLIKFGLLFSFYKRTITYTIVMRIIVTYSSGRSRNLQMKTKAEGASLPTTCVIKNDSLIGFEGKGENIDYDCTGEAPKGAGNITEAVIDTNSSLYIGSDEVKANEISFSKDSDVGNIADATKSVIILDSATAEFGNNQINLTGILKPIREARENIKKDNKYSMQFYDVSSDSLKSLTCTVTEFRDGVGEGIPCNLSCDAASTPIETYYGNLTQAKIETSNMYLTVNPDFTNGEDEETLLNSASGSANNIYYRKNSSGLSGGAIAGIVIACVVVLAAASIASIMLRKPSPPIDNTTVVGLKTVENM